MKRYDIEMNGDDMLIEEAPDGRWVEADDALRLEAKVRELEAELDKLRLAWTERGWRARLAEQKLADANALLREVPPPLASVPEDWCRRRDRHLAGQPAAPKPGDRRVIFGSFEPRQFVSAAEFTQPAAPSRTEAEPQHHCGVSGWRPDLGDAPCPACEKASAAYLARRGRR